MSKQKFKVRVDLYELPHLHGFWISDPAHDEWLEEASGQQVVRTAYLFLGHSNVRRLNVAPDDEDTTQLATYSSDFAYEIDNGELILQQLFVNDDSNLVRDSEIIETVWAIGDDGRFSLELDDIIWFYVPATVDDFAAAGFDRDFIEATVSTIRKEGGLVVELFDEALAKEMIDEARAKEEAEDGFGPDNPLPE